MNSFVTVNKKKIQKELPVKKHIIPGSNKKGETWPTVGTNSNKFWKILPRKLVKWFLFTAVGEKSRIVVF